ncbi:MAG: phosphate acyltransferase, partial [Bryobacteraceae bacterium]
MPLPEAALEFMNAQIARLRRLARPRRIVFPEGDDPRIREAARRLARDGLAEPILIGREPSSDDLRYVAPGTSP